MNGDVKALAAKEGVTTAVIVDDAFDEPTAAKFSQFIDTVVSHVVSDEDKQRLYGVLGLQVGKVGELREALQQDAGVQKLAASLKDWPAGDAKTELERVFDQTTTAERGERDRLAQLIQTLEGQNIKCLTEGTESDQKGKAELLFVDLYLGSHPDVGSATAAAVKKIESLRARYNSQKPQMVVLMSNRGPELQKAFANFWRDAGLFGGQLRSLEKFNLTDETAVLDAIYDLLSNRTRVAAIETLVKSCETGITGALKQFGETVRRLDASDYVDIQELVLDAEGVPMSEYLLEIYTLYLVSLFEANEAMLEALRGLDADDQKAQDYPANEFEPSIESVRLMDSVVFHPKASLRNDKDGLPAEFKHFRLGDILYKAPAGDKPAQVWLVTAQDCDIIRGLTKFVLLVPGRITNISPFRDDGGTIVVPMQFGEERKLIYWNPKAAEPLAEEDFGKKVREAGLTRIRRMRFPWALKVQRQVLDVYGRIPTVADVHGREPLNLTLYVRGGDSRWHKIVACENVSAYMLVGRPPDGPGSEKKIFRLMLPNASYDRVCHSIKQAGGDGAPDDVKAWVAGFDTAKRRLLRSTVLIDKKKDKLREVEGGLAGLMVCWTDAGRDFAGENVNGKSFLVQVVMAEQPAAGASAPAAAPKSA